MKTCSYAAVTAASCFGWTNSWVDVQVPWALENFHQGPDSHGRWQCPPLQMSPHDRAWTRKGLEGGPAAGPAACRPALWPLLPILGEPAQSWSNLRDSQSVAGMADPPTASVPQQAPAPPQLSPLSGAYLLIVVGEPFSEEHKKLILQKLQQGKQRETSEARGLSTQSRACLQITNSLDLGTMWTGGGLMAQTLDLQSIFEAKLYIFPSRQRIRELDICRT